MATQSGGLAKWFSLTAVQPGDHHLKTVIFFLRTRMLELAEDRRRFGSPRLYEELRWEGLVQNHKRTERIYHEENLSLRIRKRVKRPSHAVLSRLVLLARMNNGRWIL